MSPSKYGHVYKGTHTHDVDPFQDLWGVGVAGRKVKSDRKVLRSAEAETHLGGDGGGIDGIIGKKQLFLLLLVNHVALNRQKVHTSCDVKGDSCFNNQQVCSNKLKD